MPLQKYGNLTCGYSNLSGGQTCAACGESTHLTASRHSCSLFQSLPTSPPPLAAFQGPQFSGNPQPLFGCPFHFETLPASRWFALRFLIFEMTQWSNRPKIRSPLNSLFHRGFHGSTPIAGWFIMESAIKMDDIEVALFQETSICIPWEKCRNKMNKNITRITANRSLFDRSPFPWKILPAPSLAFRFSAATHWVAVDPLQGVDATLAGPLGVLLPEQPAVPPGAAGPLLEVV